MSWNFDEALEDELLHDVSCDRSRGTFEFRVGELEEVITIELGRFMDGDQTKFRISHAIKAPWQRDAYRSSRVFDDDPVRALRRAINCITFDYRQALEKGVVRYVTGI